MNTSVWSKASESGEFNMNDFDKYLEFFTDKLAWEGSIDNMFSVFNNLVDEETKKRILACLERLAFPKVDMSKVTKCYVWGCDCNDGTNDVDHSDVAFESFDACYLDMRKRALIKMEWNTQPCDFADMADDEYIGYQVKFDYKHGIITHESYSGLYTYKISVVYVDKDGEVVNPYHKYHFGLELTKKDKFIEDFKTFIKEVKAKNHDNGFDGLLDFRGVWDGEFYDFGENDYEKIWELYQKVLCSNNKLVLTMYYNDSASHTAFEEERYIVFNKDKIIFYY